MTLDLQKDLYNIIGGTEKREQKKRKGELGSGTLLGGPSSTRKIGRQ